MHIPLSTRHRSLLIVAVIALMIFQQAPAAASDTQGSPIWAFSDGQAIRGAAQLTRDDHGITFNWNPSDLPVGNAYTTWIVAFNRPENCETPNQCGEGDLFSDDVQTAIIHGGGGVSDDYGQLTVSGSRALNDTSGLVVGPGTAITNPNAEIHIVLRRHYKAHPNRAKREGQLTTFDDGCDAACPDTHFAIFPPRPDSTFQTAEMTSFASGGFAPGAGTLVRTRHSLNATLAMSGLDSGSAYTVWWVLWNDPSLCAGDCGEDDLFIEGNAIFYATGFIADSGGTANVRVTAHSGNTPVGLENFTGNPALQPGNGFGAEVHMVARRHLPPTPGSVGIQIGTFEPPPDCSESDCFDQYAFVFSPAP